jgi:pimeloyl-ACP methyl ester carboxylesterase
VTARLGAAALALLVATGATEARERNHYLLVHGAWHGAWCWYRVKALLERGGDRVTTVDLPGHGIDRTPPERVSLADYTTRVVQALDGAGEPVVLVGHSMGGVVVSQAAEARPGAVAKLVYLAAFLLPAGGSVAQATATDRDSRLTPGLRFGDRSGDGIPDVLDFDRTIARAAFYGMSPGADVALAGLLLVPNPFAPLITPVGVGAPWESVRRFYVRTAKDGAVSPAAQAAMLARVPVERVFTLRSDHSPFFSAPEKLVRVLRAIAAR